MLSRTTTFTVRSILLLLLLAVPVRAQTITIAAGDVERRNSIIEFSLPPDATAKQWQASDEAGNAAPLQVIDGRALLFIDRLDAGQTRTYTLQPASGAGRPHVQALRLDSVVNVTVGGKDILRYQGEKSPLPQGYDPAFQRGGYIHPVYSPSGLVVTDDYPQQHKHHHGIWSPWTKTSFEGRSPDFWNMGNKTGTVEFVELAEVFSGDVAAGFTAHHRLIDLTARPEPKPALDETWHARIYRAGNGDRPCFIFDLAINQQTAGSSPLLLPKYHYGGLGFRGHKQWDGQANCSFLTSEGKDRSNGNETRGRWCRISGRVDGRLASVIIMNHPANFRYPQPMRLHPSEPFFCYAPQQLGDFSIEPGKPYVARYRFIVADEELSPEQIDRLWEDYATPAQVTVR